MRQVIITMLIALVAAISPAQAQQALTGLARLAGEGARLSERRGVVSLSLEITQTVPWRVFTLDEPWRVVLDFSELDWTGTNPDALAASAERVAQVAVGTYRPGWSRMVIELEEPMAVISAEMRARPDGARVELRLEETDIEAFAVHSGAPESALFHQDLALPAFPEAVPTDAADKLTVVLDPGHGGIDPGAEREGIRESDLVLAFARELKELLLREGPFDVILTRDDDRFVPLESRVAIARHAGADVFLSIHADALAEGRAHGATVYTLSEDASDTASAKLAERHDRADLLAGVDLSESDDAVALLLLDLARTETAPRSERLAAALVEGIHSATRSTHKTPRLQAGFSVLKAADIPSALIELGFLSSARDREKLIDPAWRASAAEGIRDALLYWAIEDAAASERLRK